MMLVMAMLVMVVIVVVSANRANLLAFHKASKLLLDRIASFHSFEKLFSIKICNRCSYENCAFVMLLNKRECLLKLLLSSLIGMTENNAACVLYLITEKLAKVLQIHLALVHIGNNGKAVEFNILSRRISDRSDNVAELSNTRGLNYNAVGRILIDNLTKSLAEIANERTTDATRIHFCNIDTRILEKSAVYTYLAKFVFDKHQLFSLVRFLYELIYKRCLSRAQKAGNNIYLCHYISRAATRTSK